MHGNQYNTTIAPWTVGYVIGQMPLNLVLTRLSRWVSIPLIEMTRSPLTVVSRPHSRYCHNLAIAIHSFHESILPTSPDVLVRTVRTRLLFVRSTQKDAMIVFADEVQWNLIHYGIVLPCRRVCTSHRLLWYLPRPSDLYVTMSCITD